MYFRMMPYKEDIYMTDNNFNYMSDHTFKFTFNNAKYKNQKNDCCIDYQKCCKLFSPSKIDRCARIAFPLIFIMFNYLYWSIMTFISQHKATNQKTFVPLKQNN